jgi:hypothetical protein
MVSSHIIDMDCFNQCSFTPQSTDKQNRGKFIVPRRKFSLAFPAYSELYRFEFMCVAMSLFSFERQLINFLKTLAKMLLVVKYYMIFVSYP